MATEHTPLPYAQAAVDLALTEYGLQTDGHRLLSCGAHTGHTVKDMALAISPEVADYIKRACNGHYELLKAAQGLLDCLAQCSISSGVCCCGDDMERHSHPMNSGHSPVDSGEYYTRQSIEALAAALKLAGGQQ